jgi:acyl dehydratase
MTDFAGTAHVARPMRILSGATELRALIGEPIGYSNWRAVTQGMVNAFADTTGDHQWIHTDPVRAASGPYGRTIAHGFLTLALASALVAEVLTVDGFTRAVNYGANRVRFPAPLTVGARVRAEVGLNDVTDIDGGIQIVLNVTIEREGGDRPVCVAELVSRLYR